MKFVALATLNRRTSDYKGWVEVYEEMGGEDGAWHVPDGVKLLDSVHCLSHFDLIAFYEAPDPETAEQFLQELEPYASVERIVGIKCELCENAKEMV